MKKMKTISKSDMKLIYGGGDPPADEQDKKQKKNGLAPAPGGWGKLWRTISIFPIVPWVAVCGGKDGRQWMKDYVNGK